MNHKNLRDSLDATVAATMHRTAWQAARVTRATSFIPQVQP
jgi:hypothetical protein